MNPDSQNQQPTHPQPSTQPVAQQPVYQNVPTSPPKSGKATASLVLGIISLLTWPLTFLTIAIPIVGIILGILGRKSLKKSRAVAGIALSAIGLVISLVVLTIGIIAMSSGVLGFAKYSYTDTTKTTTYGASQYSDLVKATSGLLTLDPQDTNTVNKLKLATQQITVGSYPRPVGLSTYDTSGQPQINGRFGAISVSQNMRCYSDYENHTSLLVNVGGVGAGIAIYDQANCFAFLGDIENPVTNIGVVITDKDITVYDKVEVSTKPIADGIVEELKLQSGQGLVTSLRAQFL